MTRKILLLTAIALTMVTLSSCMPGHTYEVMARHNGRPVQRLACRIHYKINDGVYNDRGRSVLGGLNFVALLHQRIDLIGNMTGVHWVFDGYTQDTYESARGTDYRLNKGVLIELRGPRHWSQPMPAKGPVYLGGSTFFEVKYFAPQVRYPGSVAGTIDHELAHQYGLGDTYDNVGGPRDVSQKMGDSQKPWGAGDRAGFKAMTFDSSKNCARLRAGQREVTALGLAGTRPAAKTMPAKGTTPSR